MVERRIQFIETELDNLVKTPFAFAILVVMGLGLGFAGGMLCYSGQISSLREQINTKDGEIRRYRVALGITPASPGALVELNNEGLALRTQFLVGKLRQLTSELEEEYKAINERMNTGKINQKQAHDETMQAMRNIVQNFDDNFASDALNIEDELRKRMTPESLSHIVRVPAFVAKDQNGNVTGRVTLLGMDDIGVFADEMEQMSKLLPPDKH
jgi:hypothetical protein